VRSERARVCAKKIAGLWEGGICAWEHRCTRWPWWDGDVAARAHWIEAARKIRGKKPRDLPNANVPGFFHLGRDAHPVSCM